MIKRLRYNTGTLIWETLTGLFGLVFTLAPNLFVENILGPVSVLFWCLTALFAAYLTRTVLRHKTEIELSDSAIRAHSVGGDRKIEWDTLEKAKLSHFGSGRSTPTSGVSILTVRGNGTKIVVESTLKEFDTVLEYVSAVCRARPVEVDTTSRLNFDALGYPVNDTGL
ncbi:MAG: hypothetical protein RIM33_10745 [Alphaproteobacteria bacterium]